MFGQHLRLLCIAGFLSVMLGALPRAARPSL